MVLLLCTKSLGSTHGDPTISPIGALIAVNLPLHVPSRDQFFFMAQQFQIFTQTLNAFKAQQVARHPLQQPLKNCSEADHADKSVVGGYSETDESNYQTTKENNDESVLGAKITLKIDGDLDSEL